MTGRGHTYLRQYLSRHASLALIGSVFRADITQESASFALVSKTGEDCGNPSVNGLGGRRQLDKGLSRLRPLYSPAQFKDFSTSVEDLCCVGIPIQSTIQRDRSLIATGVALTTGHPWLPRRS